MITFLAIISFTVTTPNTVDTSKRHRSLTTWKTLPRKSTFTIPTLESCSSLLPVGVQWMNFSEKAALMDGPGEWQNETDRGFLFLLSTYNTHSISLLCKSSFRDAEVNWDYVRCLPDGESVSVDGTHLGHNLPDGKGNRYCINLVSVAGNSVN